MGLSGLPNVGAFAEIQNMPGFRAAIREVNGGLRDAANASVNLENKSGGVGRALQSIGNIARGVAVSGLAVLTTGIIAAASATTILAKNAIETSISVESAFAGVAKTTDGLVDSYGNLTNMGEGVREQFREIAREVPIALEALLAIGELGGQLGVPREALAGFARTIADLAIATNLSQEQAADGLARIANIYEIASNLIADNTSRAGSAVVDLGNKFAATESEILEFATRIAGAGRIAGLTQADLFGIGAAMASVGVEAEAGGTAVQKVLLSIHEAVITGNKDLELLAEVSGITAEQFASLWQQDAGAAFTMFVEGLGAAGDDAIGILDELDLKDQRLIRAFLSLAGAGNLLEEAMLAGNEAFAENIALSDEAEKRYNTTESKIELIKNRLRDMSLTLGDMLKEGALQKIMDAALPAIDTLAAKLPGILDMLAPAIDRGAEQIGRLISLFIENLPGAIDGTVAFITDTLIPGFNSVSAFINETLIPAINGFLAVVTPIIAPLMEWFSASDLLNGALLAIGAGLLAVIIPAIASFIASAAPVIAVFAALVAAGALLSKAWEENFLNIRAIVETVMVVAQKVWEAFKDTIVDQVWPRLQDAFNELMLAFEEMGIDWEDLARVVEVVAAVIGAILILLVAVIAGAIESIAAVLQALARFFRHAADDIKNILEGLSKVIMGVFDFWAGLFTGDFDRMMKGFVSIWEGVFQTIYGILGTAVELIIGAFDVIWSAIDGFANGFAELFYNLYNELVGHSIIPDLVNEMVRLFTEIDWLGIGEDIVLGILKGIKDNANKVLNEMKSLATNALKTAKKALGIKSPSKAFMQIGENLPDAMKMGVERMRDLPVRAMETLGKRMIAGAERIVPVITPAPRVVVQGGNTSVDRRVNFNANYTEGQRSIKDRDDLRLATFAAGVG
jgi:TP901 family phage tail tape measure protein